jgi:hypothetical protein
VVPVEIQGSIRCQSRLLVHLTSLSTPTPPFPLERVLPFSWASAASISNQRQLSLDLKAYPVKTAYRERASFTYVTFTYLMGLLEWNNRKARGGAANEDRTQNNSLLMINEG